MAGIKRLFQHVSRILLAYISGAIVIIVFAPLFVIISPVRKLLYRLHLVTNLWGGRHEAVYMFTVLFFYLELLFGLPILAVIILGIEHLFEGIVASAVLVAFFAFQYPKLFRPSCGITFTNRYITQRTFRKVMRPGVVEILYFSIFNLGLGHLNNIGVRIDFDKGFTLLANEKFTILGGDDGPTMQYSSSNFSKNIVPYSAQQFMAPVKVPTKEGVYKIRFGIQSESTVGTVVASLTLEISNG